MTQFNYQHLTKELLESTINGIFSSNRIASRRRSEEQYLYSVNLAYPMTLDECVKQKSTKIMKENELDITITDSDSSYGNSRVYSYKVNGEYVLRFDQIPYPECCGIAIIKNFSTNGDMQKADFLDAMDQFLADIKKNDRFSKVLFYTNAGSNGDRMFSMINEITILDPFKNKRSGNTLVGFEIDLLEKKSNSSRWHDAKFLNLDDEPEEADGEHDEEEYNNPFGLMPDVLPQQAQPEQINERRPVTLCRGILDRIESGDMPHLANSFLTEEQLGPRKHQIKMQLISPGE